MRENDEVAVTATLLDDDGGHSPLGVLRFPHPPQIGSHVLLHPPGREPEGEDPEHVYRVVNVFYVFARPGEPGGERRCEGWQIDVAHLGSHRDVPRRPEA